MKHKILCIEDELTTQALLVATFKEYDVVCVSSIKEAEKHLLKQSFSALLIDIQLPDGDGLRFLTQLVQDEKYFKIPIMILSSHTEISNKVMAFTFGAEDFITKPFDPVELNARVSAKIRRRQLELDLAKTRKIENVLIDFDRQKVFFINNATEKDLGLTSIEIKILTLLTKRLEQVYSREQIMDNVWGETFITDRTVDSHVAHLRQKIEKTQLQIETVKNFGYRAVIKS